MEMTSSEFAAFQNNGHRGTFERQSLSSSENPYARLPARRKAPPKMRKKATYAATYLMLEGRKGSERIVICQSTPQWVADIVNRAADPNGVVDEHRQRLVYESLKMIGAGSPPSVASADDLEVLRKWEHSTKGKRRYVRRARMMMDSPSEKELLQMAQTLERYEVYFQVFEQLKENYDGSLYDMNRTRRVHSKANI